MVDIRQLRFELAQLGLEQGDVPKSVSGRMEERAIHKGGFLGKVREPEPSGGAHDPFGGVFDARDKLDQGGFADAVRTDQRDFVATIDDKLQAGEDTLGTIPFSETQ